MDNDAICDFLGDIAKLAVCLGAVGMGVVFGLGVLIGMLI